MQFIGTLGNVDHFKCEGCGLEYSARRGEADPICCDVRSTGDVDLMEWFDDDFRLDDEFEDAVS